MKGIYLDYASATPLDNDALKAMEPYFSECFYNASATYSAGRQARAELEGYRAVVAGLLGAKPAEIIFTAGGTEANNLAIQGVMRKRPDREVLVSSIEHESVLAPAGLYKNKQIPVSRKGIVDLEELAGLISDKTVLISVMLVNNELGIVQPLKEISGLINDVKHKRLQSGNKLPLWLHSDAAQAPNFLDIHTSRLGVDLMTLNGGKIYGPKYSGALYVKAGVKLAPLILGGGQESNLRSGTENIAGAAGFATALDKAQSSRKAETNRERLLRAQFLDLLAKAIPGAVVNGDSKHCTPHIVHVTFPGTDNERLMIQLDEAGISAATGSACSAREQAASHVALAIGLSEKDARSSLRFSFGRQTTTKDIETTVKILKRLL